MVDTRSDLALRQRPRSSGQDRQISFVVLLVLTAVALYVVYIIYRPFLTSLFLAGVLTIAFLPLHRWIARRVRDANAAALITETLIVLFVLVPLILISLKLLAETANLYSSLSRQDWSATAWFGHLTWLSEAIHRIAQRAGVSPEQVKATIVSRARVFGASLLGMVGSVAHGLVQQITSAVLTFLILFFFLRDREAYSRGMMSMLPLPSGRAQQLSTTLRETILANAYGILAVAIVEGALVAFGFWMTGLRAPLLWGAVVMIVSFLPRFGPALVWIPGVVVLAIEGSWVKAILLLVWGAFLVSAADFVVRDKVVGRHASKAVYGGGSKLLILLSMLADCGSSVRLESS
jgi:predicted PurR-regulated permease PerM